MMSDINRMHALEAEILARLSASLTIEGQAYPKVDVQAWPDNPKNFTMRHPLGTVLAIYKGTKYAKDSSTNDIAEYELSVMSRTLRDANPTDTVTQTLGVGVYALIDTVVSTLHGWKPDLATGKLLVTSDGFDNYLEGVWTYSIRTTVPMFPRILFDPAPLITTGPWTDETCLTAPNLTEANHVYEPNQGEQ